MQMERACEDYLFPIRAIMCDARRKRGISHIYIYLPTAGDSYYSQDSAAKSKSGGSSIY